MKFSKPITITKKMKITGKNIESRDTWEVLYFEISNIISKYYLKKYKINIEQRYLWRISLDIECGGIYNHYIDYSPAYKKMTTIVLKTVCKRILRFKDPYYLKSVIKASNQYRKNDIKYKESLIEDKVIKALDKIIKDEN